MIHTIATGSAARQWLWEHLLDAELNSRYWRCMVDRYKRKDQTAQIFLAVVTSGTVAGWALWEDFPLLWRTLSGASTLVAVSLPILKFPTKVELAADLYGRWTELCSEYERLWVSVQDGECDFTDEHMIALSHRENSVAPQEAAFRSDLRLAEKCQAEVKRSRGLK